MTCRYRGAAARRQQAPCSWGLAVHERGVTSGQGVLKPHTQAPQERIC